MMIRGDLPEGPMGPPDPGWDLMAALAFAWLLFSLIIIGLFVGIA